MKIVQWLEQHQHQVTSVSPQCSLHEMLDVLLAARPSSTDVYVVDDEGRLLGHIPAQLIFSHYLAEHQPVQSRRQLIHRVTCSNAEEMMEPHPFMARLDEEMDDVLPRQLQQGIAELAVVDGKDRLCGVIDLYSVARSLRAMDRVGSGNSLDNQ